MAASVQSVIQIHTTHCRNDAHARTKAVVCVRRTCLVNSKGLVRALGLWGERECHVVFTPLAFATRREDHDVEPTVHALQCEFMCCTMRSPVLCAAGLLVVAARRCCMLQAGQGSVALDIGGDLCTVLWTSALCASACWATIISLCLTHCFAFAGHMPRCQIPLRGRRAIGRMPPRLDRDWFYAVLHQRWCVLWAGALRGYFFWAHSR
jgi:hypothetical protein